MGKVFLREETVQFFEERDADGLAKHNYREWQELSADGVNIPPPNIFTKLIYPLQYVKYNFVPEILRYAWYHVWIRLIAAYAPYHRKLVLEGAKLDAYLQQKGHPEQRAQVNRRDALLRFHWKMSPLQNISIRLKLLQAAISKTMIGWRQKNIGQAEDSNLAAPKVLM